MTGRENGTKSTELYTLFFLYELSYFASRWIVAGRGSGKSIAESRGG